MAQSTTAPTATLSRTRNRPRLPTVKLTDGALTNDSTEAHKDSLPGPHVQTSDHILRKFRGQPPSLVLHLHPNHFRFDRQDGTFGYNSPMKMFLDHVKAGTVPHDILEELVAGGVPFYDGCLIVEINDHKTTPEASQNASSSGGLGGAKPFSIHNHNIAITPSPYAPYPSDLEESLSRPSSSKENAKSDSSTSMPAPEKPAKERIKRAKAFTVVLHPTPLSLHREISMLVSTPAGDARSLNRRQHSANSRDGATPLSALPPTPLTLTPVGRNAKRQKMMLEEPNIHSFEADVINNTAPPLILDPADNLTDAQAIQNMLIHPLHDHVLHKTKGRKRTIAEVAQDEAQAAEEERLILIGDPRLTASASGEGGSSTLDGQGQARNFQPDFAHFKLLEDIKRHLEEEARKKKEEEFIRSQEKRESSLDLQRRREQEIQNRQEQQRQNMILQQRIAQSQRPQQMPGAPMHPQMMHGIQQNMMQQVSQGQQGSPLVGNHIPANSSPLAGGMFPGGSGAPMMPSSSTQGPGSPPRPASAMQAPQPMAHQMARNVSQQTSQPSRNGTPQMNPSATPQMGSLTPQQRMASVNPMMNGIQGAPVMNAAQMMVDPQTNGQQMNPHHQAQIIAMQQQRQAALQQQQQRQAQARQFQQQQQQQQQMQQNQRSGVPPGQGQNMMQGSPQNPSQFNQMTPEQQLFMRTQAMQQRAQQQRMQQQQQQQQANQQPQPQQTPQMSVPSPAQASPDRQRQMAEYRRSLAEQARRQQQASTGMQQNPSMTPQQPQQQFSQGSNAGSPVNIPMTSSMQRNASQFPQSGPANGQSPHVQNVNNPGQQGQQDSARLQRAQLLQMQQQQQQQQQAAATNAGPQALASLKQRFMQTYIAQRGGQAIPEAELNRAWQAWYQSRQAQQGQMSQQRMPQQQQTQQTPQTQQAQHQQQQQRLMMQALAQQQQQHQQQQQQQGRQPGQNQAGGPMNEQMLQLQQQRAMMARREQMQRMANGNLGMNGMPNGMPQGMMGNMGINGMNGMNMNMNGMNGMPQGPGSGG